MRLALEELGYDSSAHRSHGIDSELLEWSDVIVVMGNVHEKFVAEHYPDQLSKVSNWLIKDPHFASGMDLHRMVARQIRDLVYLHFG